MPTTAVKTDVNLDFDFEQAREDMVERQVRTWEVFDAAVLDIMKQVPREAFVPERFRKLACSDTQIPLGDGEVMMQPKVEGRLLQALGIRPDDSILEIGTGSGYLSCLLASLGGRLHSIDINPLFTEAARQHVATLELGNVTFATADAATLDAIDEDFDCIVVTGSMPHLHPSFCQRLKIGGRLFAIVGSDPIMEAQLHTRVTEADWVAESLFDMSIPALKNAWNPKRFTL